MAITPKEKALELVTTFEVLINGLITENKMIPKECARKVASEIIDELVDTDDGQTIMPYKYWQNVINEINLL